MNDLPKKTPNLDELIEMGEKMMEQYPDDFALKLSVDGLKAHRRELQSECPYNHWSIFHGLGEGGKFCPYCGLDISRFKDAKWNSEEEKREDQRAAEARR